VDVNLTMAGVSGQTFTYIIQLQDELRIKSPPVTGKINISSSQQSITFPQPQQGIFPPQDQPSMFPPQGQPGSQAVGQQLGSVVVIIDPLMAAESGAMWRVENGPWKKSGETSSNIPVGIQTIEFQDVGNWIKPEKSKSDD